MQTSWRNFTWESGRDEWFAQVSRVLANDHFARNRPDDTCGQTGGTPGQASDMATGGGPWPCRFSATGAHDIGLYGRHMGRDGHAGTGHGLAGTGSVSPFCATLPRLPNHLSPTTATTNPAGRSRANSQWPVIQITGSSRQTDFQSAGMRKRRAEQAARTIAGGLRRWAGPKGLPEHEAGSDPACFSVTTSLNTNPRKTGRQILKNCRTAAPSRDGRCTAGVIFWEIPEVQAPRVAHAPHEPDAPARDCPRWRVGLGFARFCRPALVHRG